VNGRRFFVRPGDVVGGRLVLRADEAHHARRVLRLGPGARVVCFDGEGSAWEGTVEAFSRDEAVVGSLEPLPFEAEPAPRVTLAQAVLKGEKMDLVVQKATELGASRIVPVLAERCVGAERAVGRREERWRRIALEAAKQCERNRVSEVADAETLASLLQRLEGLAIAFVERAGASVTRLESLGPSESVTVLVGPEGGWAPAERDAMRDAGVAAASLGPRVLRAETAAIAALAVVFYALGGRQG